jgi:Fe-S oxidoreductase
VLEDAGFQIVVPRKSLCCGRPLYDFGMLPTARRLLREVLDTLRPEIESNTPVVGLEPSCVAVFRDELMNLFPMDEDAKRLSSQTFILSEFLEQKAPHYQLPQLKRKALVQKHCHHEHVMKFDAENSVLKKLGLDYELLDSGCCGMAGSFGFESDHYDVSVAIGERRLLPAVRATSADTLIIADGFSCREQIAGLTSRGALHLAQVIQMALRDGPAGPRRDLPEMAYQPLGKWEPAPSLAATTAVAALGVLAGLGVAWALMRRRDS